MADKRLRELEREYFAEPTQEGLLRLLEARIRAGLEKEPHRIRALVAKPPVRCFLHTAEVTSLCNGASLILEIPATELNARPFPELGGEWVFGIALASAAAKPFLGFHIGLITFEEASTGAHLSTKPDHGNPLTDPLILLHAGFNLRFTWQFNPDPPPPEPMPPPILQDPQEATP